MLHDAAMTADANAPIQVLQVLRKNFLQYLILVWENKCGLSHDIVCEADDLLSGWTSSLTTAFWACSAEFSNAHCLGSVDIYIQSLMSLQVPRDPSK